jgi:hypothetical protein
MDKKAQKEKTAANGQPSVEQPAHRNPDVRQVQNEGSVGPELSPRMQCDQARRFAMPLLKPIDIKRQARVPYKTVIGWLQEGHPQAGLLPSIDFAGSGRRHSYRIRRDDWEAFLARLNSTTARPAKEQDHDQIAGPSAPRG